MKRRVALAAPPEVMALKMKKILPRSMIASVVGVVWILFWVVALVLAMRAFPDLGMTLVLSGVVLIALSAMVLMLAPTFLARGKSLHIGHDLWRDELIEKLNLGRLIEATNPTVHFGMFSEGTPGPLSLAPKWDAAVLLQWSDAVAIYGGHHARQVIRAQDLQSSELKRLWNYPPRLAWRIRRGGHEFCFASIDEPDFAAAAERVRSLVGAFPI